MKTIEAGLQDVRVFQGLSEEELKLIAGCGTNIRFREGETLFRDGEEASTFYLLRHGSVALETFVPARGAVTIETLYPGGRRLVVAVPAVPLALRRTRAFSGARDELRRRLPSQEVRDGSPSRL